MSDIYHSKKVTSFPNGHSVFNQMRTLLWVGKPGAYRRQREHQQQIYFEQLSCSPPTHCPMLSQARSSRERLSRWVPPPPLLLIHHSKLHIELPCNRQDQAPGSTNVGLLDLKIGDKTYWYSTLIEEKNCKGHVDPSCCPIMESLLWLCCPGLA